MLQLCIGFGAQLAQQGFLILYFYVHLVQPQFGESEIYRVRFTDLIEWVLQLDNFEGKREDCNEGHLEMIQSSWVYEWRDNQN